MRAGLESRHAALWLARSAVASCGAVFLMTGCAKEESLTEARGALPVDIQYEHGAAVRIPVALRGVNRGSFDPSGLLIDGSAATREHRATFAGTDVRARQLQGSLVPACRGLRIEADETGAFTLTRELDSPLDYGGSLEVHASDGSLLGRMPIAVLTSSPRARPTSPELPCSPP